MRQYSACARGHAAPDRYSPPDDRTATSVADGDSHRDADSDAYRRHRCFCSMVCAHSAPLEPQPQRGAPCGVVDFFDFPLAAPEGDGAGARWSFGRYSERYSGIHAGEDWVYDSGDNLGRPVYSIGHGTVLFAQPLGWGVDQGTIIVRHVFTDGQTILSFYGHLQPDSVVLNPGDCVTRGESSDASANRADGPICTLKFAPSFPIDPAPVTGRSIRRLAGWKPPTEYIWDQRLNTSPGVKWTRPFTVVELDPRGAAHF